MSRFVGILTVGDWSTQVIKNGREPKKLIHTVPNYIFTSLFLRMYNHYKTKLQAEIEYYGKDLVQSITDEIVKESHRASNECLVPPSSMKKNDKNWIQAVVTSPEKKSNQTCYMLTQQERLVTHLQIEQILRWKKQYPTWRMSETKEAPGNDVPNLCYDPNYAKTYRKFLAKTETQKGWGFWDFVQMPTNEFDIKQTPAAEIQHILKTYPNEVNKNNFIYNDPLR